MPEIVIGYGIGLILGVLIGLIIMTHKEIESYNKGLLAGIRMAQIWTKKN